MRAMPSPPPRLVLDTNVALDLFVFGKIPPTVASESMQIDYVHVYRP